MNLIEKIKDKARKDLKTLVLPEATDERVIRAADRIAKEGFAKEIILLGEEEKIYRDAQQYGVKLKGVKIIDPVKSRKMDEYAQVYYELCKDKNITLEVATETIKDPLYFGPLMVKVGDVDAMVTGSVSTSAVVIRITLQIIGRPSKTSVVSGFFIMIVPDCSYGEDGIMAFADAAVNPNPNSRQLADIAISTAQEFNRLTGVTPRVAMLSFSTKGSTEHKMVDKVVEATRIVKETHPEILIDGELQPDAALVPFVAKRKAPSSSVAGKANVLIFPDLNSANIGYKLVERLAKAEAYGPFLQGLNRSISDLSRGCSVDDIVNISAIALVRGIG